MKKYRDEIAEICHEMLINGHRLGLVNDAEMEEFEADAFVQEPKPEPYRVSTEDTKHINHAIV